MDVEDIDSILEKVLARGGKVVQEKALISGAGWFAQIEDPEHNRFGLMQLDESTK